MADAEIRGRAERERRLPHRRPGGEDDEVAGLETGGEVVDLLEPRRDAGDVGARLVQVHDPLEALLEQGLDVGEVARHPLLRELEDDLLGAVDEVGRLALPMLPEPRDLRADAHETAQRRHLLDDARVVLDVRRGRDERRQLGDLGAAPHPLQLTPPSSSSESVIASTGSPFAQSASDAR